MSAPLTHLPVLSTLNADGSRRKLRPRPSPGRWFQLRRIVAYGLMLLFVAVPWLTVGGKPLLLLDVPKREFTIIGRTFLPTDGVLLMLLLLAIFVGIVWITALAGRAWCGYACPQTVYLEFLFRPLERLLEGKGRPSTLRLTLKYGVFAVLSFFLGNVFLSYFVGPWTLLGWLTRSPLEHFTPFLVVGVTSALVFADFAYFREQMCTVACPYARLQSALLDKHSLVVGYDKRRGEPRGRGKERGSLGDCVDCSACVSTCPTGIDIRDGLQLECVACAQCVDACDRIMDRVGKPRGLIRYVSQHTLETTERTRLIRPRTVVYPVILLLSVIAMVGFARQANETEVTLLRATGAPFERQGEKVIGQIRVKIRNRDSSQHRYRIELVPASVALVAPENPLLVSAGAQRTTSVFAVVDPERFVDGGLAVSVRVSDGAGFSTELPYRLLGPERAQGALP